MKFYLSIESGYGIILFIKRKVGYDMAQCICCGKSGAEYIHFGGGYVCESCVGEYFTCPDCGRVFDADDMTNGDAGNGFCADCASEH